MAKAKNDNFKSTKKKSNNKKQNVKVKMKKDNSKMYLMIGITLIVIAVNPLYAMSSDKYMIVFPSFL